MPESSCFYCDAILKDHEYAKGVSLPPDAHTWDHVVPKKIGKPFDSPYRIYYGQRENLVPACPLCNVKKGSKDPLDWMASYKLSDLGAERLRDRLLALGFPTDRVECAWNHRIAALANRAAQLEATAKKRAAELIARYERRALESGQDGNAAAC